MTVMPNRALSSPAYRPARPSRATIFLMACMVLVSAFLDSTCALVESVIKGYLLSSQLDAPLAVSAEMGHTDVRAIDSSPPPAPASAWATLSLCCEAAAWAAGDASDAFCACACGCEAPGSGFAGVGAATLSDMLMV